MAHESDAQILERTGNSGRFFTEHRQVAWVLLFGTLLWGVYGYRAMPQRKDPDLPVRVAVAVCPWPGGTAVDVEESSPGQSSGRSRRTPMFILRLPRIRHQVADAARALHRLRTA